MIAVKKALSEMRSALERLESALANGAAPAAGNPGINPEEGLTIKNIMKMRGEEPVAVCTALFGEKSPFEKTRSAKTALKILATLIAGEKVLKSESRQIANLLGVANDAAAIVKSAKKKIPAALAALSAPAPADDESEDEDESAESDDESEDEDKTEDEESDEDDDEDDDEESDDEESDDEDDDEESDDEDEVEYDADADDESDDDETEDEDDETEDEDEETEDEDEEEPEPKKTKKKPAAAAVKGPLQLDAPQIGEIDEMPPITKKLAEAASEYFEGLEGTDEDEMLAEINDNHWPYIPASERERLRKLYDKGNVRAMYERLIARSLDTDTLDSDEPDVVDYETPYVQTIKDESYAMCCALPLVPVGEDDDESATVDVSCARCKTVYVLNKEDGELTKKPAKPAKSAKTSKKKPAGKRVPVKRTAKRRR